MTVLAPPTIELRDYQRAAVDALFEWFRTRDGDPCVAIATGGGKSLTMAAFIAEARTNYPKLRVCLMAPQIELIRQNVKAAELLNDPRDIGIYSASANQKDASRPITVASVQSIARNPFGVEPFDILVLDEAHCVADAESGQIRQFVRAQRMANPHVRLVGFTATPYKLSSGKITEGPNALFAGVAYEASVLDLIERKFLARPRTPKAHVTLSTEGVAMRGGEFVQSQLATAVDIESVTEAAVEEAVRLCADRQHWLCFAVSIEHARHICESFERHGVSATLIHGELPRDERIHRIEAFTRGEVRVAVNVNVLLQGFDFPAIDAVILMRPTASPGMYLQMVGRGMRLAPGKTDFLVVDMASCIETHGPVDAVKVRDKREKGSGEAVVKVCPDCESYVAAGVRLCPECHHEFPPPPLPLTTAPSDAPILSSDIAPHWVSVTSTEYSYHEPRPPKTTPTLKATYYDGFRIVASEWVCVEHEGFARTKAEAWWSRRSPDPCPRSVTQALTLTHDFRTVTAVARLPDPANPRYQRVVDVRFADDTKQEPCIFCHFFATDTERCTKWDAVPPPEVRAVGCPDFQDPSFDLPF